MDSMCYRLAKNGPLNGIEELGVRIRAYLEEEYPTLVNAGAGNV
jgi:hypothetical protein